MGSASASDGVLTVSGDTLCAEVEERARPWLFASDRPDETVRAWIDRGGGDVLWGLFGPTRAQVLGITAELADGRRVCFGGRVVKNVAGFDLARAFVGAHGELGRLVQAHLRVRPAPRGWHAAVRSGTDAEEALSGPGCAVWAREKTYRFLRLGEPIPPGYEALVPHDARAQLREAWREVRSCVELHEGKRGRVREGVVLGGPRIVGVVDAPARDRGPLWAKLKEAVRGR